MPLGYRKGTGFQCTRKPLYSYKRALSPCRSLCTTNTRASSNRYDCNPEDLYTYSAQRWLWNETKQLRNRYVSFDLQSLVQVAEEAAGNNASCTNITKLPEGNFNKAFLVTMRDGRELVVKIPNPNAGPSHYTTASEVATMQYARENLQLPVPKVLTYCSRVSRSKLGAEYIVVEKAQGIELGRVWESLKARDKLAIVKQIGTITSTLARARFPSSGSLYFCQDVSESESIKIDNTFAVGPTTGRAWFDDRRGDVDIHRGPWTSTKSFMNALAQREMACLSKFPDFHRDSQHGSFNGPGGYRPTKTAKLSVLQDYLKIYQYILPRDNALNAGIIWHNDLHTDNVFVDQANPTQITSIIDWQAVAIYPMFLIAHHPSLIEYDGPKPERLVQPRLPDNIDELSPQERKAAKELYLSQTFWVYYESQKLLAEIATDDAWKQIVGEDSHGNPRVSCPLKYTSRELEKQRETYAKWERDVERKAQVLDEVGVYTGWTGAVSPGDYEEVVRRLRLAKERFLDRESRTPEERAGWEKVWPFGG
ncbi:hypothetical protein BO78DRAFT_430530 [Aspergillus sclerotiicarbonarius CBS 121057]|uniref:Altered inheritance of mitochondria protein 9, mitochondrial n=1 Tax=Aspergillus sclerotiicarbonarius (strain CBS 121057 / IBT 28362) TaxID=1448318 RepID=A0A319FF95_ASPSB|nr:hypothetical protein BO78DRAFT_430530 [Aspergillus sclerotiicarbonarius CBS 121057]